MASSKCVDLKVDRNLIDPNFNSYKLSLDALPTYSVNLDVDVDVARLPDDLYSFQHVKAFGIHNHLYFDIWNPNSVYYVDERWRIQKSVVQDWKLSAPEDVFSISDVANRRLIPGRLNVSIHFTSSNWVTLSDGTGRLILFHTGNRQQDGNWKVGFCGEPLGSDVNFTILHSVWNSDGKTAAIHVLCLCVVDAGHSSDSEKHSSTFVTRLEWLTFLSDAEATFELARVRRLEGKCCPNYAVILPAGTGLSLMGEKPFHFIYDSVKPVEDASNSADADKSTNGESDPSYTWMQDAESITISFQLPADASKADIGFQLKSSHLNITYKDQNPLLTGDLHSIVNVDSSTWTLSETKVLEVSLIKAEPVSWSGLVVGDDRGKMVFTAEQLDEINQQLDKYTSGVANADPEEGRKPAFNTEQLEECDAFSDESSAIWNLDGETHSVSQQINIGGNQWLFSAQLSAESLPVMCLRHDVDGLVWQPSAIADDSTVSLAWQHIGTFDALGYVQASKQQRKFVTCSPCMSYAVIGDCVRHVYIYHRPSSIKSPLRNRRTGETITAIARQQLVSIDSTSDILGLCASDTHIFVLVGKTLYAVKIGNQ